MLFLKKCFQAPGDEARLWLEGRGMGSWGRLASGGISQSLIGGQPQSGRGGSQDYRTMPGATKSAFFPTKDGDRGLDSLRTQNSGKNVSPSF